VLAFFVILFEFFFTLLMLRFFYRLVRWIFNVPSPRLHPAERAAQVADLKTPEWWTPRPQWWQRQRRGEETRTPSPYAARPALAD
jgi:hypothetical protein